MNRVPLACAGALFVMLLQHPTAPASGADAPTASAADFYPVGARVEVRRNDKWLPATVVKRDGAKAFVKFDGASDNFNEWVTTNQIREASVVTAAGTNAPPTDVPAPVPSTRPAPKAHGDPFAVGAKIEVKWGSSWYKSTVVKREGARAYIHYDGWGDSSDEWVGPDRMRAIGQAAAPGVAASPTIPSVPNPLAPDARAVRVIAFAKPPGGWSAAPDPATKPARPLPQNPPPIFLPPMAATGGAQHAIWQHVSNVILPAGSAQGLVVHTQDGPGVPYVTQTERIDFAAGSVSSSVAIPEGMQPIDASADGRRILLKQSGHAGGGLAQIWSIESKPGLPLPSKVKELQPFTGEGTDAAITAAEFIDADHVIFSGGGKDVVMVDVPSLKVIWSTHADQAIQKLAVSPGRGQVAVPSELGVFLLNPMTGDILGLLEGTAPASSVMSFSPDGKRLAAVGYGQVSVWDIESGKQWRRFTIGGSAGRIDWISNDYVMLGGTRLVDLERRVVMWTYLYPDSPGAAPVTASAGGKFWYVATEKGKVPRRQLVAVSLPQEEVKQAIAGVQPDQLYSIYPGMKVSLSVNINGDGDQQAKVVKGLTQALQRAGMTVADGAPVKLEATTSAGESQQMRFHRFARFGQPGGDETVTVTPTKLRLAFVTADGKTAWETNGITGQVFGLVTLKEGQTLADAVAEAQKPRFDFFFNPTVPEYVPLPREKEGFGESSLTLKGVQGITLHASQ